MSVYFKKMFPMKQNSFRKKRKMAFSDCHEYLKWV